MTGKKCWGGRVGVYHQPRFDWQGGGPLKILLGSSRVAMKLLLKILLQCCLPVDGSSSRRWGSAQAARRTDGVGRDGAQRRARSLRSHAWHRSHGGRRGPGKNQPPRPIHTPPAAAAPGRLGMRGERRGTWGMFAGRRNLSVGDSALRLGTLSPGSSSSPIASCSSFFFIWSIPFNNNNKAKPKLQPRNAAWAGTVGPVRGVGLGGDDAARLRGRWGRASLRLPGAGGERA